MGEIDVSGLLIVAAVAFSAPLVLGLAPAVRVPAVVLELVAGIAIGPSGLGWVDLDQPVQVMAAIGLIPTVALFVVFFMRFEARERWSLVIPYAVTLVLFIWFTFDYFMSVPWPPTLLGHWFPALKAIPSV